MRKDYNPEQPRVPAGEPDGGQWADGGGGAAVGGEEPTEHPTPVDVTIDSKEAELVARTQTEQREIGMLIGVEGDYLTRTGTARQVRFDVTIPRDATMVHTHPGGSGFDVGEPVPFSDGDYKIAAAHVARSVVFDANGNRFDVSGVRRGAHAEALRFGRELRDQFSGRAVQEYHAYHTLHRMTLPVRLANMGLIKRANVRITARSRTYVSSVIARYPDAWANATRGIEDEWKAQQTGL